MPNLVLTRKIDEPIDITVPGGIEIVVRIVDIDCNRVRVSVSAPSEVIINRREITERIKRGKEQPCEKS